MSYSGQSHPHFIGTWGVDNPGLGGNTKKKRVEPLRREVPYSPHEASWRDLWK